jgi:hypothetical protein
MAAIAFFVVSAVATEGAPVWVSALAEAAAVTAGSLIDSAYVYPAIFGRGPGIMGPRLDDLQYQTASEGAGINVVMGTGRVAGNLIWAAPFEEVSDSQGGGKGGGGQSVTSFTYFNSLAVGVCLGPIRGILTIWADARIIYQSTGFRNLLVWSDSFSTTPAWTINPADAVPPAIVVDEDVIADPIGPATTKGDRITIATAGADTELAQRFIRVKPDTTYTVSFYAMAGSITDGNFVVFMRNRVQTGVDGDPLPTSGDPTVYVNQPYTMDGSWQRFSATFTTDSTVDPKIDFVIVASPADTGDFYLFGAQLEEGATAGTYDTTGVVSNIQDGTVYDSVTIYPGNDIQMPDPTMEADLGVGEVPGYRGLAYVVFERLNISKFGNRIPQFSFLVQEDPSLNSKSVLDKVLSFGELTSDEYDNSDVWEQNCIGLMANGPQSPIKLAEPIFAAFNIMGVERGTQFIGIQREKSVAIAIPQKDLMAVGEGEGDVPRHASFSDVGSYDLPAEVNVTYQDPAQDYQRGSLKERRPLALSDTVKSLQFPLVLSSWDARNIAYRALWAEWSERQNLEVSLPPKYIDLEETDLLAVTIGAETHNMRVVSLSRGDNFIVKAKGVIESSQSVAGTASDLFTDPPAFRSANALAVDNSAALRLEILDVPALRDQDSQTAGFYYAVATDAPESWRGAVLYGSEDDANFSFSARTDKQAVIGEAVTALPSASVEVWDDANVLQVKLVSGELESRNEDQVSDGENWMLVGSEIIGFRRATLVEELTYNLSGLLRGLRNTEANVGTHVVGERVVLLDSNVQFKETNLTAISRVKYYRAVPSGQLPENYESIDAMTLSGSTLKPFSPVSIAGSRDASNNLTLTWLRSTRSIASPYGTADLPELPDELNSYEVDVTVAGVIKRTMVITGAMAASYSAANQTTDGITPGNPVTVSIYQISSVVGRGYAGTATV